MKKLILVSTFLVASATGLLAQGLVYFSNADWEAWRAGEQWDRWVYKAPGQLVDDARWSAALVQLVGGEWQQLGARQNFWGSAIPGTMNWDGLDRIATVGTLSVQVFNEAGVMVGQGGGADGAISFQFTAGTGDPPPLDANLMRNFHGFVVPEPSTVALGVLGLGALLLFRRRK
jgi:hypothetical protein